MGWLDWGATDNLHQTFVHTLNGWSMPIYGVGLGVGIGWSLMHILTDSQETWRGQDNPSRAIWQHRLAG